jgi:ectoine hydroxylase-related dioxygenase (phytanoyl-CoA dioxygenase family)
MNASSQVAQVCQKEEFDSRGFLLREALLSSAECDALSVELMDLLAEQQKLVSKIRAGLRNVLRLRPAVASMARSPKLLDFVGELTGRDAFPVRAVLFDKTAEANWSAAWHQDMAIAVAERIDTPGFGPWSVKDGIVHVQPPCEILASMVAVRIHLDDCHADNGALRVVPGSHLHGELITEAINRWTESHEPVTCELLKGGVLAMRPLLLHASTRAVSPTHRRVLHIEYATGGLPNGLKWFEE